MGPRLVAMISPRGSLFGERRRSRRKPSRPDGHCVVSGVGRGGSIVVVLVVGGGSSRVPSGAASLLWSSTSDARTLFRDPECRRLFEADSAVVSAANYPTHPAPPLSRSVSRRFWVSPENVPTMFRIPVALLHGVRPANFKTRAFHVGIHISVLLEHFVRRARNCQQGCRLKMGIIECQREVAEKVIGSDAVVVWFLGRLPGSPIETPFLPTFVQTVADRRGQARIA
jgi:hypothetical protein